MGGTDLLGLASCMSIALPLPVFSGDSEALTLTGGEQWTCPLDPQETQVYRTFQNRPESLGKEEIERQDGSTLRTH